MAIVVHDIVASSAAHPASSATESSAASSARSVATAVLVVIKFAGRTHRRVSIRARSRGCENLLTGTGLLECLRLDRCQLRIGLWEFQFPIGLDQLEAHV